MKMYFTRACLLSLSVLATAFAGAFTTFAYAGPSSGGGGGAFVCRDTAGNITRSLLLDLWESSNVYGWVVDRNNVLTANEQIDIALKKFQKIDPGFASEVAKELLQIQFNATYLPSDVVFNPPEDAKAKFSDPECPLAGMLFFDDRLQKLFVSDPVFKKLETQTDVAGAWLHESIYKSARDHLSAQDSLATRTLVGCLMSKEKGCLINDDLKSIFKSFSSVEFCRSKSLDYYKGSSSSSSSTLVAIKRVDQLDFSGNFLLSRPAKSLNLNPSLPEFGLAAWNVVWVESSGGFWPTPLGLTVSNRLTGEYFRDEDVKCSAVEI